MHFAMPLASITAWNGKRPQLGKRVFLANGAHLSGDLIVGDDTSFWFNTTVRADANIIRVGARTNIQDGTVIHDPPSSSEDAPQTSSDLQVT